MNEREGVVAGLRAVADFFEQHPDSPLPWDSAPLDISCSGTEEDIAAAWRGTAWRGKEAALTKMGIK